MNQKTLVVLTISSLFSLLTAATTNCLPQPVGKGQRVLGKEGVAIIQANKESALKIFSDFEKTLKQFILDLPMTDKSFTIHDSSGDHTWGSLTDARNYLNTQWNALISQINTHGFENNNQYIQSKKQVEDLMSNVLQAIDQKLKEMQK